MSALNLSSVADAHAAVPAPDTGAVLARVAAFVREVYALHDASVTADRVRAYLDPGALSTDAGAVRALMGSPARYADVTLEGDDGQSTAASLGNPGAMVRRRVRVTLYWGCRDEDGRPLPNAADHAAFMDLLDGASGTAPGLCYALRQQRVIPGDGWHAAVADVRVSENYLNGQVAAHSGRGEWRHEAAVTVTLDA